MRSLRPEPIEEYFLQLFKRFLDGLQSINPNLGLVGEDRR